MAKSESATGKNKVTNIGNHKRLHQDKHQEEEAATVHQPPTSVQPVNPQEPQLAGGSHPAQRRVLGLNVEGKQGQAKPHPEGTTGGIHSTGSYTDKEGVRPNKKK